MSFQQVYTRYNNAYNSIIRRAQRRHTETYGVDLKVTQAESAGLAFYADSMRKIEALGWPEGSPYARGEKKFSGENHAENPDMRGSQLDKLPEDFGGTE